MRTLKNALFSVIAVGLGLLIFVAAAEILLRLLPVNEGMRTEAVTDDQPVFRFEPNRKAVFAKGARFEIVNRVRTNNVGFVNNQDYSADGTSPLLAVIGDSFIEALMVPWPETMQARLAKLLEGRGRVYSFAASGAGLAQYLAWAGHVRDVYHPQAMTIVIIPNDFSESLYEREHSPGFHSFVRRPDGSAEMRLTEYRPSRLRSMLRHSALAMYLFSQVKVQSLIGSGLVLGKDDARFVGNVEAVAPADFLAHSKWAVDRFLDLLPEYTGLPRDRVQLVVEGVRPQLYTPESLDADKSSYWVQMRTYVLEQAQARGHEAIDMNLPFAEAYRRDGRKFEFPTDGHWNGEGHRVAAETVARSRTFGAVFGTR